MNIEYPPPPPPFIPMLIGTYLSHGVMTNQMFALPDHIEVVTFTPHGRQLTYNQARELFRILRQPSNFHTLNIDAINGNFFHILDDPDNLIRVRVHRNQMPNYNCFITNNQNDLPDNLTHICGFYNTSAAALGQPIAGLAPGQNPIPPSVGLEVVFTGLFANYLSMRYPAQQPPPVKRFPLSDIIAFLSPLYLNPVRRMRLYYFSCAEIPVGQGGQNMDVVDIPPFEPLYLAWPAAPAPVAAAPAAAPQPGPGGMRKVSKRLKRSKRSKRSKRLKFRKTKTKSILK